MKNEKNVKRQAVVDLFLTYGWVIVVTLEMLGLLIISGVFDVEFLNDNECEASHSIGCKYLKTKENTGNDKKGVDLAPDDSRSNKININSFVLTDSNGNTCTPRTSLNVDMDLGEEAQIIFDCTNTLESGTLSISSGTLSISYTNTESRERIQQPSRDENKKIIIVSEKPTGTGNEVPQNGNNRHQEITITPPSSSTPISFKIVDNTTTISSTNPIIITTPEELSNIRHTLTDNSITHFQLANSIDLSENNFDTDTNTANGNWEPIGNTSNSFSGKSFDGNGFSITGLNISSSSQHVGLFGKTDGASISNVSVSGSVTSTTHRVGGLIGTADDTNVSYASFSGNVSGNYHIGGLIGRSDNGLNISFSNSSGMVNGTNGNIGGLVGLLEGGVVSFSSSSSSADSSTPKNRVGGLIGDVQRNSSVTSSFASGSVSGGTEIGGLVGSMRGDSSISKSFASGSVNGNSEIGGLVGRIEGTQRAGGVGFISDSNVSDSFSSGTVTAPSDSAVGRFVGEMRGGKIIDSFTYSEENIPNDVNIGFVGNFHTTPGSCVNSYWDKTQGTGILSIDGDIGREGCGNSASKTTSELQTPTNNTGIYATWNPNIWDFGTSSEYPTLR